MEKRNICFTFTQIRSNVNFGNNLREAKAKKGNIFFVTLKWHRSTCYVNWAMLIGDPVDVTTLLLRSHICQGYLQICHDVTRAYFRDISRFFIELTRTYVRVISMFDPDLTRTYVRVSSWFVPDLTKTYVRLSSGFS